jgi:hypothetical protein
MTEKNIADATNCGAVKPRLMYTAPTVSRLLLKKTESGSGVHFDGFINASFSTPP